MPATIKSRPRNGMWRGQRRTQAINLFGGWDGCLAVAGRRWWDVEGGEDGLHRHAVLPTGAQDRDREHVAAQIGQSRQPAPSPIVRSA
jgi:hypothetical protein